MGRYNLDARALKLGVKHSVIIREINARGVEVYPSQYYQYKNGFAPPKSDLVMKMADEIVSEMENAKGKENAS